jgi:hypothetical protein
MPVSGLFPVIDLQKTIARVISRAMLIMKVEPQKTAF